MVQIVGTRIADLTDGDVPDSFDRIPVERTPYGSGTNRRINPRNLVGLKIAIVGDSLSAQWPLWSNNWASILEQRLNNAGARVECRTFSTGGHTFFRAVQTTTTYGSDSAVDAVIAYKPDVVLTALGGNDCLGSALGLLDNRTLSQIQGDATEYYNAIKAGLPRAALIQTNLRFYDEDNFTTSNVKNKGIHTLFMQLKTSGILQSLNSSEMLDDAASTTGKQFLDDYDDLIPGTVAGISGVNLLEINLFRICRLGCILPDKQHLTEFGQALFSGYVVKGLRNITDFTDLVPVIATQPTIPEAEDPDELFTDITDASSDGYTEATPDVFGGESVNAVWGWSCNLRTDNWYSNYRASVNFDTLSPLNAINEGEMLSFTVTEAQPSTAMSTSWDGASFAASGYTTDRHGNLVGKIAVGLLNMTTAAHTLRMKIGSDVFGPYTITFTADVINVASVTAVGNVGTGEDTLITQTIPAGFALPVSTRYVHVVVHGTQANTAAAKTLKFYFGSQILAGTLVANLAGDWHGEYWVVSTGSDTQAYRGYITIPLTAASSFTINFNGTLTEDDDAAITVKCTGEATNNNDITQNMQIIELH